MGRRRLTDYEKRQKELKQDTFVSADPRCKQCYYWRYLGGADDEAIYCCHFALIEGKLRERDSPTACGSFKDKHTSPRRKASVETVPMSQWGCGGLAKARRNER